MKSLISYLKEGYYHDEHHDDYNEPDFEKLLYNDIKTTKNNIVEFDPEDEELVFDVKLNGKKVQYVVSKIYLSKNKKEVLMDAVPEISYKDKYEPLNELTIDDVFYKSGKYFANEDFDEFYKMFYSLLNGHEWDDRNDDGDDYYDSHR